MDLFDSFLASTRIQIGQNSGFSLVGVVLSIYFGYKYRGFDKNTLHTNLGRGSMACELAASLLCFEEFQSLPLSTFLRKELIRTSTS